MKPLFRNASASDLVGGALLLLLGAGFAIGGVEYGIRTSEGQLLPGAMPFLSGILLAVFGAGVAITGLRKRPADPPPTSDQAPATGRPGSGDAVEQTADAAGEGAAGAEPRSPLLRVFALLALTGGAIVAITWFDAYITLAVLVFLVLTVFERVPAWTAAAVSAGVIATCHVVFSVLLNIPLPSIF